MIKKIRFVIILLLSITSTSYTSAAENNALRTEFIPLYNVLPDEIIPLIRPFLADGDVLTGSGNELIVKTSPERLVDVLAVVKRFDQQPHRLLITVIQGDDTTADRLSAKARVKLRTTSSDTDLSVHGHISKTTTSQDDEKRQSVQTTDGKEAFIQVGTKQPLPEYQLYGYGDRAGISSGIRYHDVTSGFYVQPKLIGNQVRLEVSPWSNKMSRLGGGVIDTSGAKTTLTVKLGEWIELGGANEQSNKDSRGILSRYRSTKKEENRIFIRVEDLDRASP